MKNISLSCRIGLLVLFGFTPLVAAPHLETKPNNPYFAKFEPVQPPAIHGLLLKKGARVAICGDSITEQRMYSRLMEDYLTMCVPQLDISVRQYGWSGEQVPSFVSRMTNDCLRFDPTVATTCYGMNDCHYRRYDDAIGQTYRTSSDEMVDDFKAHHVKVILGSPGCVSKVPWWVKSPDITLEDLNLNLCQLRNIDIGIAKADHVRFADLFWPMLTANFTGGEEYGADYAIPGNDGVHPHWAGHLIMAYSFLTAMGLDGEIGAFTVNLKNDRIKVSKGHRVVSAKDGEFQIESSRYPFCPCEPPGQAAASYPVCGADPVNSNDSIRSGMTLVPFNQRLNRLMLIVKHADAPNYKVTWGDSSQTFTGDQLKHGINLAAEFPSNPFSSAFAKVDAAVAAQQAFETKEMKELFRPQSNNYSMADVAAQTDKVVGQTESEHARLVQAVHDAFVPVTYTLKIEAE